MMFLLDIIALIFSSFAFGFSLYALWVVRVSPYRLIAYPPALSYLNRKESSLVLDLTFFNPGRVRVAILDMEITLWSKSQRVIAARLKPHAYHQSLFAQANLAERHSIIARFTPFLINQQETVSRTVYFSGVDKKVSALLDIADEDLDRICISFKVNSRWNKKTFNFDYAEMLTHQRDKESSSLLKLPFSPTFFPEAEPLQLRGSIFDPVF